MGETSFKIGQLFCQPAVGKSEYRQDDSPVTEVIMAER
jgi:hypothetical protein